LNLELAGGPALGHEALDGSVGDAQHGRQAGDAGPGPALFVGEFGQRR
jgi:hypothetical protein